MPVRPAEIGCADLSDLAANIRAKLLQLREAATTDDTARVLGLSRQIDELVNALDCARDDAAAQANLANKQMDEMKTFGREVEAKLKKEQ